MTTDAVAITPLGAAVLAIGASSPIGYALRPIQAAMAGRLRNFQEGTQLDDERNPVRVSRLPELDDSVPRAKRVAVLTQLALEDLLQNLPDLGTFDDIPIFAGVSHDSPETDLNAIGRGLVTGSGGSIDPRKCTTFVGYGGGRIAFLSAMSRAIRSFAQRQGDLSLVVAADTRCTPEIVAGYVRERRILTTKDDGTIPGEAAVVALVAPLNSQRGFAERRFAICDPAFGVDDFGMLRQTPQATDGLGRAFRKLREDSFASALRPATVVAFGSGEICFTRSFVTAYLRNAELMPEPFQHEVVAANVGDVGAAAAGMALVRVDWLLRRPSAGGARALIYGHADSGRCAAAVAIAN